MSQTVETAAPSSPPPSLVLTGAAPASLELARLPAVARYGGAVFFVALATGLGMAFQSVVSTANLTLLFVLPVILTATMFGWGPSLVSVVAGVLSFDFFFTEPKLSFVIDSPEDIWAAGLLLVTAMIVSAVAAQARGRTEEARLAAVHAEALRALAHLVVEGRSRADIVQAAAMTLNQIFAAPAVVVASRGELIGIEAAAGGPSFTPAEEAAARDALASRLPTRAKTYPFDQSQFDFWPVADRFRGHCVIGVDFTNARTPRAADPERFVEVVAGYLAAAFRGQVEL